MNGWTTLGWVGHDSYLAIADTAVPAAKQFEALQATDIAKRVIDATGDGVIAAFTEADENVPVEVQRDGQDKIVSLRLCWTTDVDKLDGRGEGWWGEVGSLPLPKGSCVVWDPFHGEISDGLVVDVQPGDYRVEAFYTESDCLGIRIVSSADSPSQLPAK